jgi:hypothetical protein
LLWKRKITTTKSKRVKPVSDLAESSKEGCGSKRAVLPMMTMLINSTFAGSEVLAAVANYEMH